MESRNFILSSLSAPEESLVRPHLEPIALPHKLTLFRPDEDITHVHFIEQGCASLLNTLPDGDTVEVGTIGNEGMVGTPVLLEADRMPCQCDIQIPGNGWRMPSAAFKAAVRQSDTLRGKLLRFTQAHFNQVAQSAACNRLHTIEERCARWLLMCRDRVGDDFPLTQEYLAIARRSAGRRDRHGQASAKRGLDRLHAGTHHDPRSRWAGGCRVRLLPDHPRRIPPPRPERRGLS